MDTLKISNFKCFQEEEIHLADLTLLVGANGYGKSSVIQSLLLLRSAIENKESKTIALNGFYGQNLGTDAAILNQNATDSHIKIELKTSSSLKSCFLDLNPSSNISLDIPFSVHDDFLNVGISSLQFYYLSADRNGPRIAQTMKSLEYPNTGIYGEYSAQLLSNLFYKISEDKKNENEPSSFLYKQVNAWLSNIIPEVEVMAKSDNNLQTAQVKIKNTFSTDFLYAPNIGFGISHVLPIILTGLIAEKGTYMIVENPEAHLHPSAQSAIGKFLAKVADTGVHVIIETHSDHVINGVQLYAAQNNKNKEEIIINNFGRNEKGKLQVTPILLTENYDYSEWPSGFMEQSRIDYLNLIKLRISNV